MSLLVQQPKTEIFSALPDFAVALKNFRDKELETVIHKLGSIFVKHGAHEEFGLSMIHRHFDLNPKEILVQTINDSKSRSLSVPWLVNGKYAEPLDTTIFTSNGFTGTCSKKYIVPTNWCFEQTGNIVPFEFLATDVQSWVVPNAEFIHELYEALQELGMEQHVGLRRSTDVKGTNGWETTPKGERVNLVVFGEKPIEVKAEEMEKVFWSFDSKGELNQTSMFCNSCQHCHSHNKW